MEVYLLKPESVALAAAVLILPEVRILAVAACEVSRLDLKFEEAGVS